MYTPDLFSITVINSVEPDKSTSGFASFVKIKAGQKNPKQKSNIVLKI